MNCFMPSTLASCGSYHPCFSSISTVASDSVYPSHGRGHLWVSLLSWEGPPLGLPPFMGGATSGSPSFHGRGHLWVSLLSWEGPPLGLPPFMGGATCGSPSFHGMGHLWVSLLSWEGPPLGLPPFMGGATSGSPSFYTMFLATHV